MTEDRNSSYEEYCLASTDGEAPSSSSTPYQKTTMMDRIKCEKPSKNVLYVLVGCVLVLFVLILVAVLLATRAKSNCPHGVHCDWSAVSSAEFLHDARCQDMCSTRSCIRSVEYTMKRIDPSQNPCDDFYQFACGNYPKDSHQGDDYFGVIPESTRTEMDQAFMEDIRDTLHSFNSNRSKARSAGKFAWSFYTNCLLTKEALLDAQTRKFLGDLFKPTGHIPWKLIPGENSPTNKTVETTVAYLSVLGSNPLFTVEMFDIKKSPWTIRIAPPSPNSLTYIYDEDRDRIQNYLDWLKYTLEMLNVTHEGAVAVINEVADFEESFFAIVHNASLDLRMFHKDYSCTQMEDECPSLKWCSISSEVLIQSGVAGTAKVKFTTRSIAYFKALDSILQGTRDHVLINYLNIKFVLRFQPFLTERFQYIHNKLKETLYDDSSAIYRSVTQHWQTCALLTAEHLWFVIYERYLEEKFDSRMREKVSNMIEALNSTMMSIVENMDWLPDEDKQFLNQPSLNITFSEAIPEQDRLNDFFSLMETEQRPMIEDAIDLMKLKSKALFSTNNMEQYASLLTMSWPFLFDHLMPYFDKRINVSYGLRYFRFPVLDFDRPGYLDYSTLGPVLGFSLVPFVGDPSKAYGTNGEVFPNMTEFRDKFACLGEQLSKYDVYNVIENNTIYDLSTEIIALKASYKAYEKSENGKKDTGLPGLPLTSQQLFFISYTQLNCENWVPNNQPGVLWRKSIPRRTIVNAILSQSLDFGEAFRCPAGSPINPSTKCCLTENAEGDYNCQHELSNNEK